MYSLILQYILDIAPGSVSIKEFSKIADSALERFKTYDEHAHSVPLEVRLANPDLQSTQVK